MYILATAKWTWVQLVQRPWFWLWGVFAFACWPIITTLTPLGIVSETQSDARALYEVAFIGGLIGSMQGLATIEGIGWILESRPTRQRVALSLSILGSSCALIVLCTLMPALLLGHARMLMVDGWALATSILHTVALASWLSVLPMPSATRIAALPLMAWILPAVLSSRPSISIWSTYLLDAHAHLTALVDETVFKGSSWKQSWAPIIGWPALALLCCRPTDFFHALRDPR